MSEHIKRLLDKMQQIQRYDQTQIFSDLMEITALNIWGSLSADEETIKSLTNLEKKYDGNDRQHMTIMMGAFISELDERIDNGHGTFDDVAGQIFHMIDAQNKHAGQFFTPNSIAGLMGSLGMDKKIIERKIQEDGYYTVNEPCSGGGAIIFGLCTAMQEAGLNPQQHLLVYANDIDWRCVCMTYAQLALYGIPAVVTHGDALRREWSAMYTPAYVMDGWRYREKHNKERI